MSNFVSAHDLLGDELVVGNTTLMKGPNGYYEFLVRNGGEHEIGDLRVKVEYNAATVFMLLTPPFTRLVGTVQVLTAWPALRLTVSNPVPPVLPLLLA